MSAITWRQHSIIISVQEWLLLYVDWNWFGDSSYEQGDKGSSLHIQADQADTFLFFYWPLRKGKCGGFFFSLFYIKNRKSTGERGFLVGNYFLS